MKDEITIQLPEGYYFETSSDKRVVSIRENKKELSVGDYVKDVVTGDTFIIDKISNISYNTRYSLRTDGTFCEIHASYSKNRAFYSLMIDEEKKAFDDKLRETLGIKYDAKENKYFRCRLKKYYFISSIGGIIETPDVDTEMDESHYNFGNYFVSKERAESHLNRLKLIFNSHE